MKNICSCVLLLVCSWSFSQTNSPDQNPPPRPPKKDQGGIGIGIKAGLNFANVTNAASINGKSQTGFHAGIFISPHSRSIFSSHTELLFSRQGYDYSTDSNSGSVKLSYLTLAQLMAINITKYVQIQFGGQFSYLLNAKADSSNTKTGNPMADQILSFYNRFDYGFAFGLEIHPYMGIVIGVKYNLSLANLYKIPTSSGAGSMPSFIPSTSSINPKNNVVQLSLGYRL
ncbi:MAG TPA: porin family protein [Puia sp.]|nr:porin family protein [Puia sp.]